MDNAVLDGGIPAERGYALLKNIERPPLVKFEGKALSEDSVKELFRKAEAEAEPVRSIITLALGYGLRRSEICGLRWKDIDFEKGVIHIRNTVTPGEFELVEIEKTKTRTSRRDLFLIEETVPYLRSLYARRKLEGFISDKVCCQEDGQAATPYAVTYRAKAFLNRCGYEGVRLHDLRHTAASILARRLPVKSVQHFLGHEDVQTTLSIYTHISDLDRRLTSETMSEFFGGRQ